MKTKLYTILIGLLMAVCITSYGQEIVGSFTSTSNSYYCEIVEAKDGSIIVGNYKGSEDYIIYKLSPEGILIDSITIPETEHFEAQLLEIPSMSDCYLVALFDLRPEYIMLKFILINANLVVINTSNTSIPTGSISGISAKPFIITSIDNIVMQYAANSIGHYAFFDLYGTLEKDIVLSAFINSAGYDVPANDTLLNNFQLAVFSESPFTYSCRGSYSLNDTIHIVNYILDTDFNLVNRIEYAPASFNIAFASGNCSVIPLSNTGTDSHLLYAWTKSTITMLSTLIKYENNGNPLVFHVFSEHPEAFYSNPNIKDQNCMYLSYGYYSHFGVSQYLIRLDGDLNTVWDFPIPCPNSQQNIIRSIKLLRNGDIAVGTTRYNSPNTSILEVFIVRDNDPTKISETASFEKSFVLYPNPVKDQLTLRFDDGFEPESVELYDLAGRLVGTKPNGLESIDMRTMPSGVYMLRVIMKDGTIYHEKVLKE